MIWGYVRFGGIPEIDQFWDIRISGLIGFGQIWPILTYSGMVLQREGAYFGPPPGGVWEAPGHMGSGVSGPKGHSRRYLGTPGTIQSPYILDPNIPEFGDPRNLDPRNLDPQNLGPPKSGPSESGPLGFWVPLTR